MMDHEREQVYALMMDVLDGTASDSDKDRLTTLLAEKPKAAQEWDAMRSVDHLFKQAPLMAPSAGFSERALARVPNARNRFLFMSLFYTVMLIGGLIPVITSLFFLFQNSQLFTGGAAGSGFGRFFADFVQVGQALASAIITSIGNGVQQQPVLLAWGVVMLGSLILWRSVFRYFSNEPYQPALMPATP